MPSIIVVGLPNFLVSSLMRIRCCSFSISPQTHKSFGSPHVVQTSAMNLILTCDTAIYKDFQVNPDLSGVFLPNFPADFTSEVEKLPSRTRVDAVLLVDHFVLKFYCLRGCFFMQCLYSIPTTICRHIWILIVNVCRKGGGG